MRHKIEAATARPDHTVEIVWETGERSIVAFADTVAWGGVCTDMQDPTYFVSQMRIGENGGCLSGPDEVDFDADALWYQAHPGEPIAEIAAAKS
ncbi:MAG: hypothetical protein ACT4P2_09955 [Pseudomonadota bacterium]